MGMSVFRRPQHLTFEKLLPPSSETFLGGKRVYVRHFEGDVKVSQPPLTLHGKLELTMGGCVTNGMYVASIHTSVGWKHGLI